MKLRPLIVGAMELAEIKRLTTYAREHPLNMHDLLAILKGTRRPPCDDPRFVCILPVGYRVCFTVENQPEPIGLCRHISISVLGDGLAPGMAAIDEISKLFGFIKSKPAHVEAEDFGPGKAAINILQPVSEKPL